MNSFKIEIGQIFKNEKRDITIIDREYKIRYGKVNSRKRSEKWYKYHCNKDGYEGWIVEHNLLNNIGCPLCSNNPKIVVEGINDIPTTAPWMINYFQGGYDEAKLYTKASSKKIYPICPDCGQIKRNKISILSIYNCNSIGCSCSDSIPYPEKIMFNVLEQLKLNFKIQLTKTNFKWCNKYKYDFYFEYNNEQYIIETHGMQHYEEIDRDKAKTLEEEQANDRLKKELALRNGIKEENYIVIDCRHSKLEWIRDNDSGVLNSKLNDIFDLSKIDWTKVEEFAYSNLVKKACKYKIDNPSLTASDIADKMGYSNTVVLKWLKIGNKLGWCTYNSQEEQRRGGIKRQKQVEIFKNGISLGIFESLIDLENNSEKLFGVKLLICNISKVCHKERKQYKGFTFEFR